MFIKKLTAILLIASTVCFASCSRNNNAIPENALSVHYPTEEITYILPGEYPEEYAEDAETMKWGYNVYVSHINGSEKLILSGNRNEGLGQTSNTESGIYYRSGEWFGYEGGVYLGSEKVISEECVGMAASWGDGDELLIITNTENNSYVYGAKLTDEKWELDRESRIELGARTKFIYYDWAYYPIMTVSPAETMYVVTENGLVLLSVGEYLDGACRDFSTVKKTAVKTPEYWNYLHPTSAVELGGKLYIGDKLGIVEFDIGTSAFTYYPVDIKSRK